MPVRRLWVPTRYDTMEAIVAEAFDDREPAAVVASGGNFPDALAGAALAGDEDSVLLLVSGASDPTVALFGENAARAKRLYVLEGQSSVPVALVQALESAVR